MRLLRRGRWSRTVAPVLATAAVLVGSGCLYGPDPGITFSEMVRRGREDTEWKGMLPWFCRSEGVGGAHGDEGDGLANHAYAGMKKGDLTWDECAAVADFFDKAWASVKRFPTRGDAMRAGASQSVQFVPGLGTHDIVPGVSGVTTGNNPLDPARPLFLQYDGEGADAKLAGMSWFVMNGNDAVPPEGLPGTNDWFHTHSKLCYRNNTSPPVVVGNEISDELCAQRGGTNRRLPGVWMLHAWIVPGYENLYDVFSGAYNCVKGTGPYAPADDPCRSDHSDPEHGHDTTPSTTGPGSPTTTTAGGHGDHGH